MNKHQLIRDHLNRGESITTIKAFNRYKATRLSAIIFDLIHRDKMPIVSKTMYALDQDGKRITYKVYYIEREA